METVIDKKYCMSSFLMFRTVFDRSRCFAEHVPRFQAEAPENRIKICSSEDLFRALETQMKELAAEKKPALALSGGIDSAILAKFMPKGSIAYTFKCIADGAEVLDESETAARYAAECGLRHKTVEIRWSDMEELAPILMRHKGAPIHSIEVQIYKAALEAKKDGADVLVFGESADILYGGMDRLLSKEWTFGEFVERYSHVLPFHALKDPVLVLEPYKLHEKDGYIDVHRFMNQVFFHESLNSYINACAVAGIEPCLPFSRTVLGRPLDYARIRAGENKYYVREVFRRLYPSFTPPPKLPMPRPMTEWLKHWDGPKRKEFMAHCTDVMTGDQKWLVFILEKFLNLLDENLPTDNLSG